MTGDFPQTKSVRCYWRGGYTDDNSGQTRLFGLRVSLLAASQYAIPAYIHSYPDRPYKVIGYLDATTAPIRRRGVVGFAARRAKELGADAIILLAQGSEYAGTVSTGNAFTSGNFYPGDLMPCA